jgi:polyhydroxyalkanoate synthase subunit PhaC
MSDDATGARGEGDAFARVAAAWAEQAQAFDEMLRAGLDAARAGAARDEAVGHLRRWVAAARRVSGDVKATLEAMIDGLSAASGVPAAGDAGTALWDEALHRAWGLPPEVSRRLRRVDPERLASLLRSVAAEYAGDLEALGGAGALDLDLEPLARALDAVASNAGDETADDPDARRMVDRLRRVFASKATGARWVDDDGAPPTGQTPRELVHGVGRLRLYRYGGARRRRGDPVLIVYSIINRPYILDLLPGYSFVEHLLERGLDVYLIEWGEADPRDRSVTLDSYVDPGIRRCVEVIAARTRARRVSLLGHCIGGNLALLYAATHPEGVGRMVTLTTPITSAPSGVIGLWTDRSVYPVDAIIDELGYVPGEVIRASFIALKPYYELARWKRFLEKLGDDDYARLFAAADRWTTDNVDLPGEVFRKFATEVFLSERFRRGQTVVAGRRADLRAITCPLLNVVASRDWIVPPGTATILGDLVGSSDRRLLVVEGGHVSLLVDPAQRRHWATISDFLLERRRATQR